ncbi:BA5345 family protein [Priestia abyssalis]|uniref:hypothetical protein n=1 Tax=Priestia abyssalis TaxID=1221450 RepID=UPI000995701C|nr:hypothetical protein [Priestia abyssalis]
MKFETKHLIRWGIPGWVFIFLSVLPFIFQYPTEAQKVIGEMNSIKLISSLITSTAIGIVIGYLFHQVYFAFEWIRDLSKKGISKDFSPVVNKIKKRYPRNWGEDKIEDYYYIEFLWQNELVKLEENQRSYIAGRYRHLLSTTHSLGVLFYSLTTAFSINIIAFLYFNHTLIGVSTGVTFFLAVMALVNYSYYSKNTINFMGYFLQEMIVKNSVKQISKKASE